MLTESSYFFHSYLASDILTMDQVGKGWLNLVEKFTEEAVKLDPNLLIRKISNNSMYMEVSFSNYSKDNEISIKKIEKKIKKISKKTCEFTGKTGVLMTNGYIDRVLDPLTAPSDYNIVIHGKNKHYLLLLQDFLVNSREL